MNKLINVGLYIIFSTLLVGCGAYFNQPIQKQEARIGEVSSQSKELKQLPSPERKIVVGVYNFRDQTGQYKTVESGSTFSTAITQGATTILIKALEDSKWFRPIERENLGNLLNERNIIRSTRKEYSAPEKPNTPKINPLLFADVLLEGGVISYDTNILTGGAGARYFGAGGSTQYRQDRITIYLRAVSTSTGEVLKTVYVSKTILSQSVDVGLFRYVKFKRLLEVETGFSRNEPKQLAVTEAIEKAVEVLIIEGVRDKLWKTKDGEEKDKELVDNYLLEKQQEENTKLHNREYIDRQHKNSFFYLIAGTTLIDGDYSSQKLGMYGEVAYKHHINSALALNLNANVFTLNSNDESNHLWFGSKLNLEWKLLPNDKISPFINGGIGVITLLEEPKEVEANSLSSNLLSQGDAFLTVNYGLGFEYDISERFSLIFNAQHNLSFTDRLDNIENGKRDDYYYTFGIGVNYRFVKKKK